MLLLVSHPTGSTFWLVTHKDRLLAIFFFIYINDIFKHIWCSIGLFVDDTKVLKDICLK